jgi:hypothetical protein
MQDLFALTTSLLVVLGGSVILGGVIGWAVLRHQDWRHRVQRRKFPTTMPRFR